MTSTIRRKAQEFISSKGFLKYFYNTSWLLSERLINLGVAFFVGVYVARYLGPDGYGVLSFAQSIVGFATVFASLGIKNVLTRNLVQEADDYPRILGTAFGLRIAASVLSIVIVYFASAYLTDDRTTRLIIIILSFNNFFQSFEVIKSLFQSKVLAKKIVPVAVIQTAVGAAIKIALVLVEADLVWFAVVYVVELVVAAVGLTYLYYRGSRPSFINKFDVTYAKTLLKDSWPLIFSGFVVAIYMKIDQVMIKYMLDDAAVGLYAVAVKFTSIWYFIGGLICSSLFPAVIQAKKRDPMLYENRLQNLYELMVGIGLAIAIPITIVAYPLIDLLYGADFIEASSVMIIHVWSLIFVFLGAASNNWLLTENLQKYKLSRTILGAVVNVGLNFLLIPIYGIQGAAIATLVSQIMASYVGYLLVSDTRKAFIMQSKALVFTNMLKQLKQSL